MEAGAALCLTRQVQEEQGSRDGVKLEPDGWSPPSWRQLPVQTGQHPPGGVTGRPQDTAGQGAATHSTPPFCGHAHTHTDTHTHIDTHTHTQTHTLT